MKTRCQTWCRQQACAVGACKLPLSSSETLSLWMRSPGTLPGWFLELLVGQLDSTREPRWWTLCQNSSHPARMSAKTGRIGCGKWVSIQEKMIVHLADRQQDTKYCVCKCHTAKSTKPSEDFICAMYKGVGGIPVWSSIAVLNWYRSGIYLYVCHTGNRIPIIPWHNYLASVTFGAVTCKQDLN